MIEIVVWYHKDGDGVEICQIPWYAPIYEWLVKITFCPCCGLAGFISRWEKPGSVVYDVWSGLLNISVKWRKVLYRIPVASGCEAYKAIYGKHELCWRKDCTVQ